MLKQAKKIETAKVNVLFIIMQMDMGGSERLVHNLISKLDRRIFNPAVAWFFGDKPLQEFLDLGIPLFRTPKTGRFDLSSVRMLGRIIKENRIDIVNAHHFFSMFYSFFGAKKRRPCSLVYTEHSAWEIQRISYKWRLMGRLFIKRIDRVVGVSPEVTRKLIHVFRLTEDKAFTIVNGVDIEKFGKSKERAWRERRALNLKEGEQVIGTVGNLKYVKNQIFLIDTFGELVKNCGNIRLVIIGGSFPDDRENSEPQLRERVRELAIEDKVSFLGYRSDVCELLGVVDVFCLTSVKEGLPISLIEAMAAGLPVVGTNVEGIRDVVAPGYNGVLVELGDVAGLKSALLDLLKNADHRERLGRVAHRWAQEKYSLDRCVSEYENLFLSTLTLPKRQGISCVKD